MQARITQFKSYSTAKDGTPLTGQWGAYCRLSAQFDLPEYAGKWMSCNVKPENPANFWKVGQTVEIESIALKNGYLNFTLPKASVQNAVPQTGSSPIVIEKLFIKLNGMEAKLDELLVKVDNLELVDPNELVEPPEDEIKPEDIPF